MSDTQTPAFTLATTEREMAIHGVFTTAIESGVGYWAQVTEYRWSNGDRANLREVNEFRAVLTDREDPDAPTYVVDAKVIRKGIRLAYEHRAKGHDDYHAQAIKALTFGKWDDLDYDADTADLIVQYGLGLWHETGPIAGSVVYG